MNPVMVPYMTSDMKSTMALPSPVSSRATVASLRWKTLMGRGVWSWPPACARLTVELRARPRRVEPAYLRRYSSTSPGAILSSRLAAVMRWRSWKSSSVPSATRM